ncbi:MAG: M20 family metallopeptidase [Lentisphaeria bacterium]|nr:M20 family metallopeptidase [Lentisphaeria bacterium]
MKYSAESIKAEAERIAPQLTELRRWFHRHPELGFHEELTTAKIREVLSGIPGIRFRETGMDTGVIAELPGTVGARTVGLRCDIDALPIQEANSHDYVSAFPGRMHACGHDGHIAILLGAAMLLAKFPPEHNVRFLFQPAEETTPSGAPEWIGHGALDELCAVYGSHLNATSPFGKIGFCHGPVMAGGVNFTVRVRGKGGHSAYPEECHNPIAALSRICNDLPGIRNAFHGSWPCVIVPVRMESGGAHSQIPDTGSLLIRAKYLRPQCREILIERVHALVRAADLVCGTVSTVETEDVFPITVNDPTLGENVVLPAARFLGYPTTPIVPSMGSDDFGYYAERVPSYYMTFGISTGPDFAIAHTARFDFDESILPPASAQYAACALLT